MGDGHLVEQGTHNDLLRDENGAYSRLVQSQKLREQRGAVEDSDSDTEQDTKKSILKEVPLGRKNTGRSLASEIVEQKRKDSEHNKEKGDLSLPYLFVRIGKLNREVWPNYAAGAICATSTFFFFPVWFSGLLTYHYSDRHGVPSHGYCFW